MNTTSVKGTSLFCSNPAFAVTLVKDASLFSSIQLLRFVALLFAFFTLNSVASAEEIICKMTMSGTEYSRSGQPNFVKTKTQTIRIFVKFGDQVEVVEPGAAGITCSLGAKRGLTADACDTYIDVNITATNGAVQQNGVTITLFGKPFGVKTKTCSFKIDIKDMPTFTGVTFKENNANVTTLVSGRTYQMNLSGTLLLATSFAPSGLIATAVKTTATNSAVTYNVTFNSTSTATLSSVSIKEDQTVYHFALTRNLTITVLTKPDIIPNGLTGKFGIEAGANCLNLSLGKVVASTTTLNAIRALIPAPSLNQSVVIRDVQVPEIVWSIKNIGSSIPAGTPFKVELWRGVGQLVTRIEVTNGLAANEVRTFTYTRPHSTKKLFRASGCSSVNDVFIHQDNAVIANNNWADPAMFTIKVDTSKQIEENDETNNTGDF